MEMNLLGRRFWPYLIFIFWTALVSFIYKIPLSPWTLSLIFFWLFFLPGFSLSRIFKLSFGPHISDKLMLWFILGWLHLFFIISLSILIGLSINSLYWLVLIFQAIFFVLGLILEIFRKPIQEEVSIFKIKKIFCLDNLPFLLLFGLGFIILVFIALKGSLFLGGDPIFHLALVRKAFDGQPLTMENLTYVKNKIDIVYGFPVWHIILAFLAKITQSNIFVLWRAISVPLTILTFLIWYWLFRRIFSILNLAFLGWLLFAVFTFTWDTGYLFTTLPIPHTLSQIVLLPLSITLVFQYLWYPSKKTLILLYLFLISIATVHLTGYFYYLFLMMGFTLLYGLVKFNDRDFKKTLKNICLATYGSLIILLLFAFIFEIKSRAISSNFRVFGQIDYPKKVRYQFFSNYSIFIQYAYLGLPLVILFIKKHRWFLFIFSSMLLAPLIYIDAVRVVVIRVLGYIFVKRLYGTVTWYYVVWAILLGFLLILADRGINRIKKTRPFIANLIMVFLILFVILFFYLQTNIGLVSQLYNIVFSAEVSLFISRNISWLLAIVILVTVIILLIQKYRPQVEEFFTFSDIKNPILWSFLVFLIIFLLFIPNYQKTIHYFKVKGYKFFVLRSQIYTRGLENNLTNKVGGLEVLEFINKKIPPKTVFDAKGGYLFLPVLADVHMSTYHSGAAKEYANLYKEDIAIGDKLVCLQSAKIDYLLWVSPPRKTNSLDRFPRYFTKIFQNDRAFIYQINKQNVVTDYQRGKTVNCH